MKPARWKSKTGLLILGFLIVSGSGAPTLAFASSGVESSACEAKLSASRKGAATRILGKADDLLGKTLDPEWMQERELPQVRMRVAKQWIQQAQVISRIKALQKRLMDEQGPIWTPRGVKFELIRGEIERDGWMLQGLDKAATYLVVSETFAPKRLLAIRLSTPPGGLGEDLEIRDYGTEASELKELLEYSSSPNPSVSGVGAYFFKHPTPDLDGLWMLMGALDEAGIQGGRSRPDLTVSLDQYDRLEKQVLGELFRRVGALRVYQDWADLLAGKTVTGSRSPNSERFSAMLAPEDYVFRDDRGRSQHRLSKRGTLLVIQERGAPTIQVVEVRALAEGRIESWFFWEHEPEALHRFRTDSEGNVLTLPPRFFRGEIFQYLRRLKYLR